LADSSYTLAEVAVIAGFKSPEMLESIVSGGSRIPLDKIAPLADALHCNKRELLQIVLKSWFGDDFVQLVQETFSVPALSSSSESDWITFLRETNNGTVPNLGATLRRRFRLLLSHS